MARARRIIAESHHLLTPLDCLKGAPLYRVQAQMRHKPGPPTATPIYSVLSLSSPPLRAQRVTVFCVRLLRSLVPRSQKSKTKMVGNMPERLENQLCCPPAHRPRLVLLTVQRARRFGYVALIGFPITHHQSPFTNHFSTFRLSPLLYLSLLTCHGRPSGIAGCACRISSLHSQQALCAWRLAPRTPDFAPSSETPGGYVGQAILESGS